MWRNWRLVVATALATGACGGTYCQSGDKSGTQCYSPADVGAHARAQGRQPGPAELGNFWNQGPPPTAMPATLPPPTTATPASPPAPRAAPASAATDAGAPQ